jgi:hypothetical protein
MFPADMLDQLADVLKLRRRRKLSQAHKEKLLKAGRATRFLPGLMGDKTIPERTKRRKAGKVSHRA